jgi:hypothetical protein
MAMNIVEAIATISAAHRDARSCFHRERLLRHAHNMDDNTAKSPQ